MEVSDVFYYNIYFFLNILDFSEDIIAYSLSLLQKNLHFKQFTSIFLIIFFVVLFMDFEDECM